MSVPTPLEPGRARPTRRVALHLVLGVLLYGAGANVGAGWVVLLAAMLLATVPAGWWRLRRRLRTVTVQRRAPRVAGADRPAEVELVVRAAGHGLATLHDELGDVIATTTTDGDRVVRAEPTLRRGTREGAAVTVELQDAFGLFVGRASGHVPLGHDLVVRPRPADADELAGTALDRRADGDDDVSVGGRRGTDVEGVREYRPGDPVRTVHWRASARRGDVLVRELRGPDAAPVEVALAAQRWPRAVLDRTCELVLGLLVEATAQGRDVLLHADGETARGVVASADLLAGLPPHDGESGRALLPNRSVVAGGGGRSSGGSVLLLAPADDGPVAVEGGT